MGWIVALVAACGGATNSNDATSTGSTGAGQTGPGDGPGETFGPPVTTDGGDTLVTTGHAEDSGPPPFKFDVPPSTPPDLGGGDDGPVIPETCGQAASGESTVGCEFHAVDLDQYDSSENDQYAIAVSNVQLSGNADVEVEQKVGGDWQTVAGPESVPPLGLHVFELPDHHHQGSGVAEGGTYRVTSNKPIIAYQFSPLSATSFTSDASMLYPTAAWDSLAYVPHWGGGQGGRGYITIVAAENNTDVEVIPTASTMAGSNVPAGSPGVAFDISLDAGDIAEVMVSAVNVSLGGTRIESDPAHPIAIFTAHECANIPADVTACDHIEEQLSGVRLWGRDFAAARLPPHAMIAPETSLWQIQASEDGTVVTLDAHGDVTGLPDSPIDLDAGETLEFYAGGSVEQPGDFYVHATKPIAVMNYMTGADNPPGSTVGDPAMVQLSPVEQFLPRYVVLIPNEWNTDVLVVTRLANVAVELDGDAIDDDLFTPIADGDYEVARVVAADGIHTLESSLGFSVVVVGYDEYDSYAYLGGSGTGKINPNPTG